MARLHSVVWHLKAAWQAARIGMAVALVAGILLALMLPVTGVWLVVAVAAGCLAAGLLLALLAKPPSTSGDPMVALETAGAANQVGHALLRAGLLLGAMALGLAVGALR